MAKRIDLTGRRIARWTVLYQAAPVIDNKGTKRIFWSCLCDCGRRGMYIHLIY